MFGKVYVLSDAAPCCFSEATLGELSAMSGISITVLLRARFSLLYASGTEKCRWMLTRSSHLWLDSGFLRSFSVDASILFPGLWCRIQWNVQVLRSTMVKVWCLYFCTVLELFWTSSTKCDASTKHDALLDGIRKNSWISRTMQCINTRISPLCFWGPAHSTESCSIALESSWRHPH